MKDEGLHPLATKTPQARNPASVALALLIADTDAHEWRGEGTTRHRTISARRVSSWRMVSLVVALALAFVHGHAQETARVSFVKTLENVYEYEPEVKVEVRRTGNLDIEASVLVSSQPVSGAVPEEDYEPISQWLMLSPGQTSAWIAVAIINDAHPEPIETFRLILEEPGPNTELAAPAATGTSAHCNLHLFRLDLWLICPPPIHLDSRQLARRG